MCDGAHVGGWGVGTTTKQCAVAMCLVVCVLLVGCMLIDLNRKQTSQTDDGGLTRKRFTHMCMLSDNMSCESERPDLFIQFPETRPSVCVSACVLKNGSSAGMWPQRRAREKSHKSYKYKWFNKRTVKE